MVHQKLNDSPDNGTFATNSELVGRRSGFLGPAKAGVNSQSLYSTRHPSCRVRIQNRPRKRSDGAMKTPADRGETTSLMEPLLVGESS